MMKTRIDYQHHRMIVIKVLLFLMISETNSQVNFYNEYKYDRPLFPSWYNQSPLYNPKPIDWNDRIYFTKEDVNMLPACQNEDFCEDVPNYPEEFVKDKLRTTKGISGFTDILPNKTDDLSVRIDIDEVPLCISHEKLISPKTARSVDGEWLFIVQNGKEFAQAVRIENCLEDSEPCKFIGKEYKAFCKQTYIFRKLIAVKDDSLQPDLFRFPASCCCSLKNV